MLGYILFLAGFGLLIKGADFLVKGAVSVARRLKVSDLAVGLTVVSVGSSAPEVFVNIIASLKNSSDIALGNILGSNISNILLGLGIAAIVFPLRVKKSTTFREIPFSLLAVVVMAIMANDTLIDGARYSTLSRSDGLVLLSFFSIFLYYIYTMGSIPEEDDRGYRQYSTLRSVFYIIAGITGLALGGKWVVDGARDIVAAFGISEAFVGLTLVAVGTSLPEIVTSAVAAHRKRTDIAIGNVVGSNVFNIFWVLGLTSIIRPINFSPQLNTDIAVVVITTVILFSVLFVGQKHLIDRSKGILFVSLYVLYLSYLLYRG